MEKLIVTTNEAKRTATIRKYIEDGSMQKYRTLPFSKIEWEASVKHWNEEYWKDFMNNSTFYIKIK